jgi:hypothetical protein
MFLAPIGMFGSNTTSAHGLVAEREPQKHSNLRAAMTLHDGAKTAADALVLGRRQTWHRAHQLNLLRT